MFPDHWTREELDAEYGDNPAHASAPTHAELTAQVDDDELKEFWDQEDEGTSLPPTKPEGNILDNPDFTDVVFQLEQLVSARLRTLGVDNDLTWRDSNESPHVDIRAHHPSGAREQVFEIRITLGTKEPRRLKAFVRDSLETVDRGVRIYIEICATAKHRFWMFAERVAQAIREITHRFQDFGPHRLIGVRIYANSHRSVMEPIDIMRRAHLPPSFSG